MEARTYKYKLPGGDVEVGDREQVTFRPHLRLSRWEDECLFQLSLDIAEEGTHQEWDEEHKPGKFRKRHKWRGNKIDVDFYPLEPREIIEGEGRFIQNELGGFEFEITLKEKPPSNKIELPIKTQNLKFYYQPALTPEEIAEGAIRSDNVVGSYAVYHATRTNMHRNKEDAEKYKCGKVFHIYRPKAKDALGKEIWADLDETKRTLTITVDQGWLDKAVYPVTIDPNFGYETKGLSANTYMLDWIYACKYLGVAGTGSSITIYLKQYATFRPKLKNALYDSSLNFVTNGGTEEWTLPTDWDDWKTFNFPTSPSLTAQDYWLSFWGDGSRTCYWDAGETNQEGRHSQVYNAWPGSVSWTAYRDYKISIYCTVVAPPIAGGGSMAAKLMAAGIL